MVMKYSLKETMMKINVLDFIRDKNQRKSSMREKLEVKGTVCFESSRIWAWFERQVRHGMLCRL